MIDRLRFGSVERLRGYVGDRNYKFLVRNGLIYQGKFYPDIWRITEKGRRRSKALKNKTARFIARILWKLNLYS